MTTTNNTAFNASRFIYQRGFLSYLPEGPQGGLLFVARFKYGADRDVGGFRKFLCANFTVEEYFDRHNAGETPTAILSSKGYLSTTIRRALRTYGFPETMEGKQAYINAVIERTLPVPPVKQDLPAGVFLLRDPAV